MLVPKVRYHLDDEQPAEDQGRVDIAFGILFDEVVRERSRHVVPTDSTPMGSQE
jgi:hypothetical protein